MSRGRPGAARSKTRGISTITDVKLVGGTTVKADEQYIRNSILNPASQVVEGFQPIMPTFKGQVTEEQLNSLVAYIKSLSPEHRPAAVQRLRVPGNTAAPDRYCKHAWTANRRNAARQRLGKQPEYPSEQQ